MNKAVFILKRMSADEKLQALAEARENALHDEASYIATIEAKGEARGLAKGRNQMIESMRLVGVSEEQIALVVKNVI